MNLYKPNVSRFLLNIYLVLLYMCFACCFKIGVYRLYKVLHQLADMIGHSNRDRLNVWHGYLLISIVAKTRGWTSEIAHEKLRQFAVSCSRSQVPALVLFKEKAITEVGRSTQNAKWNKFEEYIRNRVGGCAKGKSEGRRLTSRKPDGSCATALPRAIAASLGECFPSWKPSFRITEVVPLFAFQLALIKRLCFYIFLSSSALQAINKHKLIWNSPSPCCKIMFVPLSSVHR